MHLLPQNELEQLLEPLHVLHLEKTLFELKRIPCRNLVELQLISPIRVPWATQLIHLLEANPRLRTLVLDQSDPIGVPPSHIQSIKLPALCNLQLLTVSSVFTEWFLKLLVPGTHELDLRLNFWETGSADLSDTVASFFQRARIRTLFLVGEWTLLPTMFPFLPYLQDLGLYAFDISPNTLAGIELADDILPKLHTVNLIECLIMDNTAIDSGLRTLLSLPSVQRVRHWHCGCHFKPGDEGRFQELLEGEGLAATVSQTPEADFRFLPSPFC
ncbi:hypothetical protein BDV93DRAFT_525481 [Ceratobasidium sp. AG-I]|nr:hypothetical protein BDV93DRAFT_525481 [Ceratobasidium sp. AG-I]